MRPRLSHRGITLVEMLVSLAVIGIVLLVIGHAMNMMQNTWVSVRGKADNFRNSRVAIDTLTHRLALATLNTRWKIDDTTSGSYKYVADSDLHYVSGKASTLLADYTRSVGHAVFFQAPFGQGSNALNSEAGFDYQKMDETLNAWGYFVEFGSDENERPEFLTEVADHFPPRRRFRLLEFRQPAHELTVFDLDQTSDRAHSPQLAIEKASSVEQLYSWFRKPLSYGSYQKRSVTVVAENILAIILTPLDPKLHAANAALTDPAPFTIAPDSSWDSRRFQWSGGAASTSTASKNDSPSSAQRHRLPPACQLTAIALSEDSWAHFTDGEVETTANSLRDLINSHFGQGDRLAADLAEVQQSLDEIRPALRYKIISILVPMAGQ